MAKKNQRRSGLHPALVPRAQGFQTRPIKIRGSQHPRGERRDALAWGGPAAFASRAQRGERNRRS